MTDAEAELLHALALRVDHNVPDRRDPERFHAEKSCVVRAMRLLADGRADRVSAGPRPVDTIVVIRGKRVRVQRPRKPFAIFV